MQNVLTSWNKKEKNIWKTSIEWNRNENMPQRASNSPWPIWSGALHADEIAFVFGQVRVFACICICVCVWPGQSVFASICICILNFATSIFASWCVAVLKMKYTYVIYPATQSYEGVQRSRDPTLEEDDDILGELCQNWVRVFSLSSSSSSSSSWVYFNKIVCVATLVLNQGASSRW